MHEGCAIAKRKYESSGQAVFKEQQNSSNALLEDNVVRGCQNCAVV